jgi:hypothetical protein
MINKSLKKGFKNSSCKFINSQSIRKRLLKSSDPIPNFTKEENKAQIELDPISYP